MRARVFSLSHCLRLLAAIAMLVTMGVVPAPASDVNNSGDSLTLTDNGQDRSVIVTADNPSPAVRKAAQMLVDHLEAISGAKIPVTTASDKQAMADDRVKIFVGISPAVEKLGLSTEGLGPGGISIETSPGAVAVFGNDTAPSDPFGTYYAVMTLLEEGLGCRYLWLGQSGKVIPKRPTVTLGPMHVCYSPPILQRRVRSNHYSDRLQVGLDRLGFTKEDYQRLRSEALETLPPDDGWFLWQRLGGTMNLRSGHAFGHYWDKYGEEHPDWFALQPNGSRDQTLAGDRARLCVSNPELIEQIARDKIAELDATPSQTSVSLAPNDGGRLTFCMCDRCKALDAPEGRKIRLQYDDASGGRPVRRYFDYVSLTDRMVTFYNAIAERVTKVHPDALLVSDAYSVYSAPPVRGKLHPNIVIRFVPMTYLSDEGRKKALADWDAWSRAASKIYFRPNYLNGGRREGTLLVFAHKVGEDLAYLSRHRMVGTDFDSCLHNWSTHGLSYYVLAQLLWRPDADVDRLIDDYCRSGFGPAAELVRRYFARAEQITDGIARRTPSLVSGKQVDVTEPYRPEVVAELTALLDEADRLAAGDGEVLARIAFLRTGLEFTAIQAQAYRHLDQPPGADLAAAQHLLDRKYWLMRDIFQNHHLAVNVAYVAWGGGGRWKSLRWRWEGEHVKPEADPDGK